MKKPGTFSVFSAFRCRKTVHGREESKLSRTFRPQVDYGSGLFDRHAVLLEQIEPEFAG